MKKIILTFILLLSIFKNGYAQDSILIKAVNAQIEPAVGGIPVNISGDFNVDYSSGHSPFLIETDQIGELFFLLNVENNTNSDKQWRLKRFNEIGSDPNWSITFSFESSCFPYSVINPYCTPLNSLIQLHTPTGQSDDIQVSVYMPSFGIGKYKLYLGDCDNDEDSIEIHINSSFDAGIQKVNKPSFLSVFPNPSSDQVSIQLNNNEKANLKIVDLIGNIIYEEEINSTSNIDVSEFKNGIYFVTIETNRIQSQMKKLIVKH